MIRLWCLRAMQLLVLPYLMWIIGSILYSWGGWLLAIAGILTFPVTVTLVPIAILFFPSEAAGPLAVWLPVLFIGTAESLIDKLKQKGYDW